MTVVVIDPPSEVVTIEEARQQIVELPREDEEFVKSLILAATVWIDGPAGFLGRALGGQTLEMSDHFCHRRIRLPYAPIIDIVSVVTEDCDGNDETVDPGLYRLKDGFIIVDSAANWSGVLHHRIRYRAGYATPDPNDDSKLVNNLPAPIKVAILMLAAHWYQRREPVVVGATVESLPFAVDALLGTYRVFS